MKKSPNISQMLWVELMHKKYAPNYLTNQSSGSTLKSNEFNSHEVNSSNYNGINKRKNYKSQEDYNEEMSLLKKHIATLNEENEILKTKIRKCDENYLKKEKELTEIMNLIQHHKPGNDTTMNNIILIKKLQKLVFQLRSEIKSKEEEFLNLKSDPKITKLNELKLENEIYLNELKSLNNILSNSTTDKSIYKTPLSVSNNKQNTTSSSEKQQQVSKKNTNGNRSFRKEKTSLAQDELNKYKAKYEEITKRLDSKEAQHNAEIEKLKKHCVELTKEQQNIQMKLESSNSKYKTVQDELGLKVNECELLKQKLTKKIDRSTPKLKNDEKSANREVIPKEDLDTTIKLIQMALTSYSNRNKLTQISTNEMSVKESDEIICSSFIGYFLREAFGNK